MSQSSAAGGPRLAAIDAGNSALKAIFGTERYRIPNRVVRLPLQRRVVAMEPTILDGLHVAVSSPRLADGKQVLGVGALAAQYADGTDLDPFTVKATSDQVLALILTSLAVDAATNLPAHDGRVVAKYHVVTGLPMREISQHGSSAFRARLLGGHEVEFLQTPTVGGTRVVVEIEEVSVGVEGYASIISLLGDTTLADHCVLVMDVGGQSTDCAVFAPGAAVLNEVSEGLTLGVSVALDQITRAIAETHGVVMRSREQIVQALVHPAPERRNHILVRGNRTSIQKIVDEHLGSFAAQIYDVLSRVWAHQPDIAIAYLIGGGAAILRPYLEALNEKRDQFPVRFLPPDQSIWHLAESYRAAFSAPNL
ncbi:MAG: ParM/StbA family protein [Firmicutes bacterium]|nr:ParM/StbA family protein [Bacillota bacterium]